MGELFASAFFAGMLYVLIPGPATLAALSLSAQSGRLACVQFLGCHLVGDVAWSAAAILAVIGVSQLGPTLFDALGLVCGLYLIFLGLRALRGSKTGQVPVITSPARAGLLLGLTNPKAYPFAFALFTTVFSQFHDAISLSSAAPLVLAALGGFLLASAFVVFWTGLPVTRRVFARYHRGITRAVGVVFVVFGAKSVADAVMGLRGRAAA